MRPRSRAISTVVDVSLALLMLSAAIGVLAVYLEADSADPEPEMADRTAETVTAMTLSVEYTLEPVAVNDDTGTFDDVDYDSEQYLRVKHGSAASMLGDAAVTNVRFDGDRLTHAGANYTEVVAGNLTGALTGANSKSHLTAVWTPYDGATVEGRATAGQDPPRDADLSTATITVPSGMPAVDDATVAAAFDSGGGSNWDAAADLVAEAVVEGYFPPTETQTALEQRGLERSLVVYRYLRLADILGVDLDPDDGVISRTGADATEANEQLADALSDEIATDLERSLDGEVDDGDDLADAISVERTTIVVRTWNT